MVEAIRGEIWAAKNTSQSSLYLHILVGSLTYQRREQPDRRSRNEAEKAKRDAQGLKPTHLPTGFAQDEIDAEDRRPKRKVAVMIGYSGTGYKGMQM